MNLPDFFIGLAAMYQSSLPGKPALNYMRRRLDSESLSGDAIQKLYDRICDKCQYHPIWENLSVLLGELSLRQVKVVALHHWIAFDDALGRSWVMACEDPSNPRWDKLPSGARNPRLVVDSPVQGYDDLSREPELFSSLPEELRADGLMLPVGSLIVDIVESVAVSINTRLTSVSEQDWEDI
jgi:hypothetical protein